jgi:tetratricopeptide (TPR) repeat protein
MSHFDLLFTARKLWRNGHGSCRLVALERELLSFLRGPDIPGAMIPRTYFDYLQRRPTPALESVFTHNVHDVVSLAALTVHACDRVILEPAQLDEPLDLYSLARVLEGAGDWRRSIRLYEMALTGGMPELNRKKALENLAVAYRRAGEHERSLEIASQLIRFPEFSMVGYESAAIYHERVGRDFEAALQVLEEGLTRAESKRCKSMLQSRWDRLQQKRLLL